jgi:hypothetical protein
MTTRITLIVVIAIAAIGLAVGIVLFAQNERIGISTSVTGQPTDGKYYLMTLPRYNGKLYGDCFRAGENLGFLIEDDCRGAWQGDQWVEATYSNLEFR